MGQLTGGRIDICDSFPVCEDRVARHWNLLGRCDGSVQGHRDPRYQDGSILWASVYSNVHWRVRQCYKKRTMECYATDFLVSLVNPSYYGEILFYYLLPCTTTPDYQPECNEGWQ